MYRSLFRRRERRSSRSRAGGCLLWILLLIAILIVLSLMFGGFRKGTKALGGSCASACTVTATWTPTGG